MSRASKRKQMRQATVPRQPEATGPSGMVLAGLGVALLVVVLVVLLAGGGLPAGGPAAGGQTAKATPTAAGVDAARVTLLENVLKTNPTDKAALVELGNIYYDADLFSQAIPYYARELEVDPNNTNVRTDMATAYFYSGDTAKALEEGRKVLAIDPNKVQTRMNMGIWLTSLTPPNVPEAIQNWQVVVNLYPGSAEATQAQALIAQNKK
jgi:cytochrome c-type biogenesis protein CcmH/NrfG